MLRLIGGLYVTGIIVVLAIIVIQRPETDIGDAVVAALIWPYTAVQMIRASQ